MRRGTAGPWRQAASSYLVQGGGRRADIQVNSTLAFLTSAASRYLNHPRLTARLLLRRKRRTKYKQRNQMNSRERIPSFGTVSRSLDAARNAIPSVLSFRITVPDHSSCANIFRKRSTERPPSIRWATVVGPDRHFEITVKGLPM